MTVQPIRQALLEVERKFARLRVYPLRASSGSPPFDNLVALGSQTFRDVYYDTNSRLSLAGTWVRQRDSHWESKIRQAGNYDQSQFKEVRDHEMIRQQVASLTGISKPASVAFGLQQIVDIATFRESWLADDRFKIVLDQTDFGHTVGEVELEVHIKTDDAHKSKEICEKLDQDIIEFMHKYS